MTAAAFPLQSILDWSRTEAIAKVQSTKGLPPMVKIGFVSGLAMLSDADYLKYGRLFREVVGALGETERGRHVLDELGIEHGTL